MSSITSTISLPSKHTLPILGFGVWDSPQDKTAASCLSALSIGYRHIDTGQVYGNESEVGAALQQSGLDRKDIFITSKIIGPGKDDAETYSNLLDSVKRIDGENGYLDLMLIHNVTAAGAEKVKKLWQQMEKLVEEGKFRSIGVSNAGIGMIEGIKSYAKVWPPAACQLELHPWCQQREIVTYCQKHNIAVEAYCPIVRNQKANDPTLKSIAEKHSKSTAQVLIRYAIQKGWSPLPKSDNPERIKQNADVFDFVLSREEIAELDAKDQGAEGALVMVVDNETKG